MRTNSRLIIGVDFDGTCVLHEYPKVGADVPNAVRVLQRLQEEGYLFVLNTMRSHRDGTLWPAINWFKDHGLRLYGINHNPDQAAWTDSTKTYANIYIDDAALGCPLIRPAAGRPYVDWNAVEAWFKA